KGELGGVESLIAAGGVGDDVSVAAEGKEGKGESLKDFGGGE
ncbi:hypothetical protein A2U01_0069769, partial [Trifolium medium]|nr:hypothetical protein [Trifolium medium]